MSSTDLLAAAGALLGSSSDWCVGANARDADGVWCPVGSERAVAFDLYGSLLKAFLEGSFVVSDFDGAYAHIQGKIPADFHSRNTDIDFYNDSLEFGDVAALFS